MKLNSLIFQNITLTQHKKYNNKNKVGVIFSEQRNFQNAENQSIITKIKVGGIVTFKMQTMCLLRIQNNISCIDH